MAKISLATAVVLDITDSGKKITSFKVTYKAPTKKQIKTLGKDNEDILDLFKSNQKLDRRIEATEAKVEALRGIPALAQELLDTAKELSTMYEKSDANEISFDELGGVDKMLHASKLTFDISINGADKEALAEFIEQNGDYAEYVEVIAKDAQKQKGN